METPLIRVTLLNRIKDETDTAAWREFVRLYGPVVYRFARKRGLSDADAADLMQVILRDVAHNAGKIQYDPHHETFCDWLFAATCHTLTTFLSAQKERPYWSAGSGSQVPSASGPGAERDSDWDTEYRRQLATKAMGLVKPEFPLSTWQAFWKTEVDGRPAQDVGLELKMTAGAVYVAKSRVLARLHGEVQRLQTEAGAW
ncbi:RNA polymerase sigma factor [Frigoriglobus tundricola]|uniref:Putative ECF sigma factor n=1 Tax=Frigoriglobus tundricola TaxID=2774151 RepID=A0A6M5Z0B4_9BACT|nr:sigma-70 family RNA polymerase sigma factor [Frigoriglobus tundricola]QJW99759.1 putative ECF sigma factor [Frigoriglobus tundricola]